MKRYVLLVCFICFGLSFELSATTVRQIHRNLQQTRVTTQSPVAISIECFDREDCSNHGSCTGTGKCVCDDGYVGLEGEKPCGYELKTQRMAFGLTAGLGWMGGGYWYLHRWAEAAALSALSVGSTIVGGIAYGISKNCGARRPDYVMKTTLGLGWIPAGAWWIVDWFRFGFNTVKDDKGQKPKPW